MDELLKKITKDEVVENFEPIGNALETIITSHQKYNESTSGSMLGDKTQRQRTLLLKTSLLAYVVTWAGVFPKKIPSLGVELTNVNVSLFYFGLSIVLGYLFRQFWWRADLEFSNSRISRQAASMLHQLEVTKAIKRFKNEANDVEGVLLKEFLPFLEGDDKDDPYRASIMGLNFKSRFFELLLPQIVSAGANLSCLYFLYVNASI